MLQRANDILAALLTGKFGSVQTNRFVVAPTDNESTTLGNKNEEVINALEEESYFSYSKVPPLRKLFHKDSLIGFLCQDILLQNRVCIPCYEKHCYTPNSCQNCQENVFEICTVVRGSNGLSQY